MEFTVYILESQSSKRKYIGYTADVNKRLKEHNEGVNASTRNRGPWSLLYQENGFSTRNEAQKRENEIKRMKGGIQFKDLLSHAGIV